MTPRPSVRPRKPPAVAILLALGFSAFERSNAMLDCEALGYPKCINVWDCKDHINLAGEGVTDFCGDVRCDTDTGACSFHARSAVCYDPPTAYIRCDGNNDLCLEGGSKGPTYGLQWLMSNAKSLTGTCTGNNNKECIYEWCPSSITYRDHFFEDYSCRVEGKTLCATDADCTGAMGTQSQCGTASCDRIKGTCFFDANIQGPDCPGYMACGDTTGEGHKTCQSGPPGLKFLGSCKGTAGNCHYAWCPNDAANTPTSAERPHPEKRPSRKLQEGPCEQYLPAPYDELTPEQKQKYEKDCGQHTYWTQHQQTMASYNFQAQQRYEEHQRQQELKRQQEMEEMAERMRQEGLKQQQASEERMRQYQQAHEERLRQQQQMEEQQTQQQQQSTTEQQQQQQRNSTNSPSIPTGNCCMTDEDCLIDVSGRPSLLKCGNYYCNTSAPSGPRCEFDAWNDTSDNDCNDTEIGYYMWCGGDDSKCDNKGPLGGGGTCTGWEDKECVYTYCPLAEASGATEITSADCGTGELTGNLVLKENVYCGEHYPASPDGTSCQSSGLCLGENATLDCMGHVIANAASVAMDGVRMLAGSKLVNCHVQEDFNNGISVATEAQNVVIENSTSSLNLKGIDSPGDGLVRLINVKAYNNAFEGIRAKSVAMTNVEAFGNRYGFDFSGTAILNGVRACGNGAADIFTRNDFELLVGSDDPMCGTSLCWDNSGSEAECLITCAPSECEGSPSPFGNCCMRNEDCLINVTGRPSLSKCGNYYCNTNAPSGPRCEFNAWKNTSDYDCNDEEIGYYMWCGGDDSKCDNKGPLGGGGMCTGWEGNECVYTYCP